ncbi:DNA polymerase III subunit beta [Candidatus Clavichlamydia salmonicola]|uniref:DNA polymerase III subunit beta n=1 Tax=Candidatus Clavichlamydia salmonicola TaxID=469812 RepID=UPI00189139EB|nr:DNA polymerase III subunit beta [Candidatus Clavichlamydia salmonicola]MBF5050863.1 DNA polymerase III subunit beta [Candidatus Clavichlamydia salmonicola]
MKFVVSRSELSNLIRKIQNVVPPNAPIPILSHVLIEAENDELVFTATDLTVGTKCSAKARTQEKGSLSIPSRRFFQLVRELTDPNIEISSYEGSMVEIVSGSSKFRLHSLKKEEFPDLPDLREAVKVTLSTEQLKETLSRTAFAVSKEDSRYVLTGVLLRIIDGKAIFVGTDGKRLAKTEINITGPSELSGEYVLPIKAVDEISKMFGEDPTTTLFLTEDKVAFESGSALLITKLISGEYPDFQPIVTTNSQISLDLHREELIILLKQVALFTNDSAQSVRFTFLPGELILTANCAQVGEGKVSMPVNYAGDKLEIAFNPFFFLDILRHSKDESLKLGLSDSYNPGVITDSTNALFIIMPMRLHDE